MKRFLMSLVVAIALVAPFGGCATLKDAQQVVHENEAFFKTGVSYAAYKVSAKLDAAKLAKVDETVLKLRATVIAEVPAQVTPEMVKELLLHVFTELDMSKEDKFFLGLLVDDAMPFVTKYFAQLHLTGVQVEDVKLSQEAVAVVLGWIHEGLQVRM